MCDVSNFYTLWSSISETVDNATKITIVLYCFCLLHDAERDLLEVAKFLVSAYLRCAEVVQLIWESSSTGWRWSRSLSSGLQWCTDWPPRKPSNTKSSVPSVNGFRSSDLGSYWRRISQAYTETLCGISTTRQLSWASNLYVRFLCACRSSREQSASVVLLSMYLCLRVMFVIIFLWANNNK